MILGEKNIDIQEELFRLQTILNEEGYFFDLSEERERWISYGSIWRKALLFWVRKNLKRSSSSLSKKVSSSPEYSFGTKLKTAHPYKSQTKELTSFFKILDLLKTLDLNKYELDHFSPLEHFSQITTLSISNSSLSNVKNLPVLPKLQTLYAINCKVQDIKMFSNQPVLSSLYLGKNPLKTLEGVSSLKAVKALNISSNLVSFKEINEVRKSYPHIKIISSN